MTTSTKLLTITPVAGGARRHAGHRSVDRQARRYERVGGPGQSVENDTLFRAAPSAFIASHGTLSLSSDSFALSLSLVRSADIVVPMSCCSVL